MPIEQISRMPMEAPKPADAKPVKPNPNFNEFVVTLQDQSIPALNKAFSMPTGLARRQFVMDALIDTASRTQTPVTKVIDGLVASGHAEADYSRLWLTNAIVVKGDDTAQATLGGLGGVADAQRSAMHVLSRPDAGLDGPKSARAAAAALKSPQWNIDAVDAPAAWNDGLTGWGTVLASLDTGAQVDHPALLTNYRGYDPRSGTVDVTGNWYDSTGKSPDAVADNAPEPHGTHTIGTAVGSDGRTNHIGVAEDAQWYSARGLGDAGGTDGMLLRSFQYLVAPRVPTPGVSPGTMRDIALGPHVINNSWGDSNGMSNVYTPAMRAMAAMGIVNVVAAGNDGNYGNPSSVGSPASSPYSIVVAATGRNGKVASFSSRGPTPQQTNPNEEPTPFVAGPGVDVRSSVMGSKYESGWSGTSMATPAVSGVALLADQAAMERIGTKKGDPFAGSLDLYAMKDVLKASAQQASGGRPADDNVGYGPVSAANLRAIVNQVIDARGLAPKATHTSGDKQQS